MKDLLPADFICDPSDREAIEKKIQLLQPLEQLVSAIFIVQDLRDFSVIYMSQRGLDGLGVTFKDVRVPGEVYVNRFFNPEDSADYVPKYRAFLESGKDDVFTFFQQVKTGPQKAFQWYLSATRIFHRDESGETLAIITQTFLIDMHYHVAMKADRLMEENLQLRTQQHVFAALTKREKAILRCMALGQSSLEMSKELHISDKTVNTHRRNIKRKLNAKSNYDITRFAQTFDLI